MRRRIASASVGAVRVIDISSELTGTDRHALEEVVRRHRQPKARDRLRRHGSGPQQTDIGSHGARRVGLWIMCQYQCCLRGVRLRRCNQKGACQEQPQ